MHVILVAQKAEIGKITVSVHLTQKERPYLKNNQSKRAGGGTQVVEHLPSKNEALSSNPCTVKNALLMKS
jgi:hypothetical protein